MLPTEKEGPKLPDRLRVLWLVTKNNIARGKKLHISSLSNTSPREFKVVNPLACYKEQHSKRQKAAYQLSLQHFSKRV
jgi:hypothetical protein